MRTGDFPAILISAGDYDRLTALMEAADAPTPVVNFLTQELRRAEVVADVTCSPHVVRIGSVVAYRDGGNDRCRTVQIVWPLEADETFDRISILSMVGAALLGMSPGQSIARPRMVGTPRTITVLAVYDADMPYPVA